MGQYEPEDSRKVTHSKESAPGEPPRTGPREGETRKDVRDDADRRAQTGYGNSRDEQGASEKDMRD